MELAAILSARFRDKVQEFFAYKATIVHAERNYKGNRWAIYDRQKG